MARRWALGLLACLAAGPLLLGACSSGGKASTSLPSTSNVAAKPTSTLPPLGPADFPMPSAARQKTSDGVTAFTKYYVELLDRTRSSLVTAPVRDLSKNCSTCVTLADSWDEAKAAHQSIDGGQLKLLSTGSALMNGDSAEIPTFIEQSTLTFRDQSGNAVPGRSSSDVRLTGGLKLVWDPARQTWIVTQFDAEPV
jgi:hypothetical protein